MDKHEEARKMALEALQTGVPEHLYFDPVEYIFADHFRQRILCGLLDEIADAEIADLELIKAVLRFLKCEFGSHVLDEEESLFPLLKIRAEEEDNIQQLLAQLCQEHKADEVDAHMIMDQLSDILRDNTSRGLTDESKDLLKRFAANERQHLILENAIVLPLARVRLTKQDCMELGKRMAARRGLTLSGSIQ